MSSLCLFLLKRSATSANSSQIPDVNTTVTVSLWDTLSQFRELQGVISQHLSANKDGLKKLFSTPLKTFSNWHLKQFFIRNPNRIAKYF